MSGIVAPGVPREVEGGLRDWPPSLPSSLSVQPQPSGWFLPPVATKLTQSPWFLKPGKLRQPPFLHWSFVVGSGGASTTMMSPDVISTGPTGRGRAVTRGCIELNRPSECVRGSGASVVNNLDSEQCRGGEGAGLVRGDQDGCAPVDREAGHLATQVKPGDREERRSSGVLAARPAFGFDLEVRETRQRGQRRHVGCDGVLTGNLADRSRGRQHR